MSIVSSVDSFIAIDVLQELPPIDPGKDFFVLLLQTGRFSAHLGETRGLFLDGFPACLVQATRVTIILHPSRTKVLLFLGDVVRVVTVFSISEEPVSG